MSWQPKRSDTRLPLYYKDKPMARGFSRKRAATRIGLAAAATLVLYLLYGLISGYKGSSGTRPLRSGATSWADRQNAVRTVFQESWADYVRHGWGKDIYHPVSQTGKNMGPAPLGWMIVDSLDTLQIMKLDEEYAEARNWVQYELDYDKFDHDVSTFETTIRMLGGLLSAYYLSDGDELYLEKATKLGNKLMGAFETPTGIPMASVNLHTGKGISDGIGGSSTAEVATLQLEFKYLAFLTGEHYFWDAAEKVMQVLDDNHPLDGIVPIHVDPKTGKYTGRMIRLGSRGDSYYEYLIKQYLQTGEIIYRDLYYESYHGITKHCVGKSVNGLTFIGELPRGIGSLLDPKMDELVCFAGGMFALGATGGNPDAMLNQKQQNELALGEEIGRTCYHMAHDTKTGLAPEIAVFNTGEDPDKKKDFYIKPNDRHNHQRPETVETLYYLWKLTGDAKYREWGWELFQSWVKYSKVPKGYGSDNKPRYTCLGDVTVIPPVLTDNLESFWFAETLKYLYLLFAEDYDPKLDLQKIVFNTEAHPLPRFSIVSTDFRTGWVRSVPGQNAAKPVSNAAPKKTTPKKKLQEAKVDVAGDIGAAKDAAVAKKNLKVDEVKEEIDGVRDAIEHDNSIADEKADLKVEAQADIKKVEEKADAAIEKSKKVAEGLKKKGKLPEAKGDVAKPLDKQAEDAM